MFIKNIDELNRSFKILNNLNVILFSVWKDKAAEAYREGELMLIESTYRSYVNEMTETSNELVRLKQDIEELVEKIRQKANAISQIKDNPEIQGCSTYRAVGYATPYDSDNPQEQVETFVARSQGEAMDEAQHQTSLDIIKKIEYDFPL